MESSFYWILCKEIKDEIFQCLVIQDYPKWYNMNYYFPLQLPFIPRGHGIVIIILVKYNTGMVSVMFRPLVHSLKSVSGKTSSTILLGGRGAIRKSRVSCNAIEVPSLRKAKRS